MRIRLFVYVDDELVEARKAIAAKVRFSADSCAMSIEVDGQEYLKGHWNMGRIDLVTHQLEDCLARLANGGPGIIRSGVLGWTGVPFHLFEPPDPAGGRAHISRFFIEGDEEREGWFPLAGWGHSDPEELFAWVEAHRAELLTPDAAIRRGKPPMVRVPAPFAELKKQLKGAAATGRALVKYAATLEDSKP